MHEVGSGSQTDEGVGISDRRKRPFPRTKTRDGRLFDLTGTRLRVCQMTRGMKIEKWFRGEIGGFSLLVGRAVLREKRKKLYTNGS